MIHHLKLSVPLYAADVHVWSADSAPEFLAYAKRAGMRKDLYDGFVATLGGGYAGGAALYGAAASGCPYAVFLESDGPCRWNDTVAHEMAHIAAAMCKAAGLVDWVPNATTEPLAYLVGYLTGRTLDWRNTWKKPRTSRR